MVTGMASSKRRARRQGRRAVVPIAVPYDTAALPLDALHEIFLRLPAKELCRLRAVCRPWRSFLSDPLFAAAHAARHPEPLIVAGYAEDMYRGVVFEIIDLSGHVIRRVQGMGAGFERVMSTHLDLIFVAEGASGRCRVLNPGTGVVCTLPQGLAVEHAAHEPDFSFSHNKNSVVIGHVASTGECKVLRMLDCSPNRNLRLYEVITLAVSSHTRWRGKKAPPYTVELGTTSSAVVNGFVYFFSNEIGQQQDGTSFRIGSFDLETEEWRPKIPGPLRSVLNAAVGLPPHIRNTWSDFSLAALNGCLVAVHPTGPDLNLWFLEDPEKGIWAMRNRIRMKHLHAATSFWHGVPTVRPVLVLNDGRIVLLHIGTHRGLLEIYNPNGTSTDVAEIGLCTTIGLYTGNLLSLANRVRS